MKKPALCAVAIHDGLTGFTRAQETFGSLIIAAGDAARVCSYVWSFDLLTRLDLRHAAARITAEADVIIVAAAVALPLHVRSWLNMAMAERAKIAPIFVVLCEQDCDSPHLMPLLRRDLMAFAARWRAPLLCNGEFRDELEHSPMLELWLLEGAGLVSANEARCGGINE